MVRHSLLAIYMLVMFAGVPASAQQRPTGGAANPAPGCSSPAAQREANARVAMAFFTAATPEARVALADPAYKQHNPIFVKRAAADHLSDYDEFKKFFLSNVTASPNTAGAPPGNPFEIVTAQCDIVTIVHKRYVQDPTAPAGTFYPVYTFDSFRVTNGKLTEHWDSAQIAPP